MGSLWQRIAGAGARGGDSCHRALEEVGETGPESILRGGPGREAHPRAQR